MAESLMIQQSSAIPPHTIHDYLQTLYSYRVSFRAFPPNTAWYQTCQRLDHRLPRADMTIIERLAEIIWRRSYGILEKAPSNGIGDPNQSLFNFVDANSADLDQVFPTKRLKTFDTLKTNPVSFQAPPEVGSQQPFTCVIRQKQIVCVEPSEWQSVHILSHY